MSAGHFLVFGLDLLAFERGQAAQLHVEDGIGLQLGQLEALHQFCAGRFHIGRGADEVDDLIQILERDQISFEDVRARLWLFPGRIRRGA